MRRRAHDTNRNPMQRLILICGAAAAQIDHGAARTQFAREADAIPKTRAEKDSRQDKGRVATAARALLREMVDATPERRAELARELRQARDALQSDFRIEPQPRRRMRKEHIHVSP